MKKVRIKLPIRTRKKKLKVIETFDHFLFENLRILRRYKRKLKLKEIDLAKIELIVNLMKMSLHPIHLFTKEENESELDYLIFLNRISNDSFLEIYRIVRAYQIAKNCKMLPEASISKLGPEIFKSDIANLKRDSDFIALFSLYKNMEQKHYPIEEWYNHALIKRVDSDKIIFDSDIIESLIKLFNFSSYIADVKDSLVAGLFHLNQGHTQLYGHTISTHNSQRFSSVYDQLKIKQIWAVDCGLMFYDNQISQKIKYILIYDDHDNTKKYVVLNSLDVINNKNFYCLKEMRNGDFVRVRDLGAKRSGVDRMLQDGGCRYCSQEFSDSFQSESNSFIQAKHGFADRYPYTITNERTNLGYNTPKLEGKLDDNLFFKIVGCLAN